MNCHGGNKKNGNHSKSHHHDGCRHQDKINKHFSHAHSHGKSHWVWILAGIGIVVLYSIFK